MKYDPEKHHRRSIRLKIYDYAWEGVYFITLCTEGRICIFGEIIDGEMCLNEIGEIAVVEWEKSQEIRREIELGEWVIMPNHLHGIVIIREPTDSESPSPQETGAGRRGGPPSAQEAKQVEPRQMRSQPKSLSSLMQGYKSATTKRINVARQSWGEEVWQRNYFERVIRNQRELDAIQGYILDNPRRWAEDRENPDRQI